MPAYGAHGPAPLNPSLHAFFDVHILYRWKHQSAVDEAEYQLRRVPNAIVTPLGVAQVAAGVHTLYYSAHVGDPDKVTHEQLSASADLATGIVWRTAANQTSHAFA